MNLGQVHIYRMVSPDTGNDALVDYWQVQAHCDPGIDATFRSTGIHECLNGLHGQIRMSAVRVESWVESNIDG